MINIANKLWQANKLQKNKTDSKRKIKKKLQTYAEMQLKSKPLRRRFFDEQSSAAPAAISVR